MKVFYPVEVNSRPLLRDLKELSEFKYGDKVYIKHTASGRAYYKCYCINDKKWVSLGKSVSVIPVSIECHIKLL